jgi:phage terminase small subunit
MPRQKPTPQQTKFIEAMADPNTKNPTQAAIKAGCPPKNARITASRWLTKANITDEIRERKERALAHHRITPEEVLGSAAFQMRSSIDDVLDDDGSFSIERARATGAVDLIKRHKETTRTTTDQNGNTITVKIVEVEILTNQDGRKEVADYMCIQRFAPTLVKR